MTRTTLVTIAVTGPYHRGDYHWQVDGPGGITSGFGATFAEARTAAGEAAVTVLGRLVVPGGGGQLAAALQGPRVCP